jgi:hypothetical protein
MPVLKEPAEQLVGADVVVEEQYLPAGHDRQTL